MSEPNYKNIYKIGLKYVSDTRMLEEKIKINAREIKKLKVDSLECYKKLGFLKQKFEIMFNKE